jgi:PII-like signaling protein
MSTTNWTFNLCNKGSKVCFFDWIDFRGGYLDQLQDGVSIDSEPEVKELLTYISGSDAVIVFIDSILVHHYHTNRDAALHFTKARAIFQFLIDVANENYNKTFIIVGTKADSDIIPSILQEKDFNGLIGLIDEIFRDLYTPLLDLGWKGAITCVGAVGLGRVKSVTEAKSFKQAITVITEIIDLPQPVNVEIPLLYCLLQELRRNASRGDASIAVTTDDIKRVQADATIMNMIVAKITNTQTPNERRDALLRMLQAERDLLYRFKPAIPDLERIIRHKLKVLSP